jgi:hypothetical protein
MREGGRDAWERVFQEVAEGKVGHWGELEGRTEMRVSKWWAK